MINDKVKEILNEQINKEFYSAYLYLSMGAYLSDVGLYGFSKWMEIQSREEIDHGMILFNYILKRKAKVELKSLGAPELSFNGVEDIFNKAYEHERSITSAIDCIAGLTENECDLATRNFIDWYLKEQIEEEDNVLRIISKIKAFGSDKASLYLLDKELGNREYSQSDYE
ncbi:ferritin [bacterium]|nr:ferritin [bacterium]